MITSVYLWLFVTLAISFLFLGWLKKQYLIIIFAGVFFGLCALAVSDGIVISDHLVNHTEENKTGNVIEVTYNYDHELMTPLISNTLITLFLVLCLLCITFGGFMFFLNPNFETGSKNKDDDEF